MPVPFHAALLEDLRPQQANSERSRLELRARIAVAYERSQRRRRGGDRKRRFRSRATKNGALVRVACAIGLVLVALCALASQAWAMPGAWPQVAATGSAEMRSGGGQFVPMTAIQPREISIQPNDTFDWADASVGAGFTFVLGLLVAGGALVSSGRMHGKVSAGKARS
jgi:hypothetical protein